jgi:hypothetical protein
MSEARLDSPFYTGNTPVYLAQISASGRIIHTNGILAFTNKREQCQFDHSILNQHSSTEGILSGEAEVVSRLALHFALSVLRQLFNVKQAVELAPERNLLWRRFPTKRS